ncbi:glycoside hydrolase, putative [Bodo saltans]|uniref:beta-N-acetylhexosaminidase n=1 Tax=Bodo saltans TaxID=75058 RepID=A0A0S4JH44_BODSA|nr:glycoside hydrolase, putative [Bodo saltans]|eukprot:CUG90787.1 glycoside hydrolase, putative [Bodo saltans]
MLAVNCMGGTHGLIVPTAGSVEVVKHLLDATLRRHFPQSPYVHLGGDETVQFRESSIMTPAVRDELAELWGKGEYVSLSQAHGGFLESLRSYVERQHHRTSILWDDSAKSILSSLQKKKNSLSGAAPIASADAVVADSTLPVVQWWRDWHEDGRWQTFRSVPVLKILSPTSHTYFDASQHKNRAEDVYPVQDGTVTAEDVWNLSDKLTSPGADRVLGVEGCLWSETLVNTTVLWYQLLPRLSALANVAWSGGELATKGFRDAVVGGATYEHATSKLQLHVNATLHFTPLVIVH